MTKISEVSTDLVSLRLARKLRQYIGRGLEFEYDEAAEILHVDVRTLKSWVCGERAPQPDGFLRLFMLPRIGPAIANEMLELVGLTGAHSVHQSHGDPFQLSAEAAGLVARLTEMLADRHLDHMEEPELCDLLIKFVATAAGFVASRRSKGQ